MLVLPAILAWVAGIWLQWPLLVVAGTLAWVVGATLTQASASFRAGYAARVADETFERPGERR